MTHSEVDKEFPHNSDFHVVAPHAEGWLILNHSVHYYEEKAKFSFVL